MSSCEPFFLASNVLIFFPQSLIILDKFSGTIITATITITLILLIIPIFVTLSNVSARRCCFKDNLTDQ